MCLFTHFAAGALAGGVTGNPVLGLAAGMVSHAALDAIPHYDHPDWRLELGGGLLSLILLLLMPFATLPAVLGGIGGMLPDLENLFQKLGKIRRDQFIFPSHTGLVPHGRTLGPRNLAWQAAIFVVCFALLGLLQPGTTRAAEPNDRAVLEMPRIQVLESGQDLTRIRVDVPLALSPRSWQELDPEAVHWPLPAYLDQDSGPEPVNLPPRLDLSVAVPTRRPLKITVSAVSWWREPDQPVAGADLTTFGLPAIFRSVPLGGCQFSLGAGGGVLRSAILEIQHPVSGQYAEQLRLAGAFKASGGRDGWSEPAPAGLLNPELFEALARGGRQLALAEIPDKGQYNHFDLTDNWVKVQVTEPGIYRLTGQDLASLGVDAEDVDPAKLRVFQGGGLNLDLNPEVSEADQPQRVGLTEVAIQVMGGADGEWNLDDELRFYGLGTSVWRDRLDPEAGPLEHFDHPSAAAGVYWVTWEGLTTGSPLPGAPLRVTEVSAASSGGQLVTSARRRLHVEEPNVEAAGVVADNWAWDANVYSTRSGSFTAHQPVADSQASFSMDFRGKPVAGSSSGYLFVANGWLNGDQAAMGTTSFVRDAQHDSLRVRLFGQSTALTHGPNSFTFENASASPRQAMALDCLDLLYWGQLDTRGAGDVFDFVHWGNQVAAPGEAFDLRLTVLDASGTLVWDVSDPRQPRLLNGDLDTGSPQQVTLGVLRDPDSDLHLVVQQVSGLLEVDGAERAEPVALRDQDGEVDYLVIYAEPFAQAAADLADYHDQELVGVANPVARAVLVDDIYDNFAGGRKDVMAIRNYLKHVFEAGHRLRYVCLLGNASLDQRNYRGHVPFTDLVDFVPAQLRTAYPINPATNLRFAPYSSDDGMTSFDAPPADGDVDFPDLASGRLPATTVDEARSMVQIMIAYGAEPETGMWRNHVLMTSDDCNRPDHHPYPLITENSHTLEAELLTGSFIPGELDIQKVYGIEYDFPPGSLVKPQARSDINAALNKGTTIYHYVGHGAEDNLADEQIFQSRDIANLSNGMRRPLFVAFSCDVGVYDNPLRRSMAELFVASETGGAIGSICASQVSYIGNNNSLCNAFYAGFFPGGEVVTDVTYSTALMLAKAQMTDVYARRNSQRYNLFSDPGLRLPHPVSDLSFAASSVDTLRAGARQVVTASTGSGGALLGAGDSYDLRVEESAYDKVYVVHSYYLDYTQTPPRYVYTPFERTFVKLGSTVFRGSGTMAGDDLGVPFKVPSQLRYGDQASVRLLIEGLDGVHTAEMALPAVRSSTGPVDDILGPEITLSFPNRYRVRPGDPLSAAFFDTSGIAILGTSPGNSILLEFDDTGFMTEITESFNYDPNSYTDGQVVFPLPADIAPGSHKAAVHASDALGNVGSDTLSFTVAEYSVTGIRDITLFPNPTPGPCRLVFDLTDPMQVQWEIYTLNGRRIKTLREQFASAGPGIIQWDGRDDQGDQIANGTYLFVLRGRWEGDEGRELKETGKLVIMR
jgi:hypothetical protein